MSVGLRCIFEWGRFGQPRTVVHRHVHEVVAHPVASVAVAAGPAEHPMATTIRDPALLLAIDMNQLSGPLALVAHHLTSRSVQLPQPRQLLAPQDRVHC